jgi:hypothetical protein
MDVHARLKHPRHSWRWWPKGVLGGGDSAAPSAAVLVRVPAASGRVAVRATFLSRSASHRSFTCRQRTERITTTQTEDQDSTLHVVAAVGKPCEEQFELRITVSHPCCPASATNHQAASAEHRQVVMARRDTVPSRCCSRRYALVQPVTYGGSAPPPNMASSINQNESLLSRP